MVLTLSLHMKMSVSKQEFLCSDFPIPGLSIDAMHARNMQYVTNVKAPAARFSFLYNKLNKPIAAYMAYIHFMYSHIYVHI